MFVVAMYSVIIWVKYKLSPFENNFKFKTSHKEQVGIGFALWICQIKRAFQALRTFRILLDGLMILYSLVWISYTVQCNRWGRRRRKCMISSLISWRWHFHKSNFREAKNSTSFSGPVSTPANASRQMLANQTKHHKLEKDMDSDNSNFQMTQTRAAFHTLEDTKSGSYMPQKEPRSSCEDRTVTSKI